MNDNTDRISILIDRQSSIADKVEKIFIKLYGNGHEGLCDTIARLQEQLNALETTYNRDLSNIRWLIGSVLTVFGLTLTIFMMVRR